MIRVRDFLADQQVLRAPDAPHHPAVSIVLPTYHRGRTGQLDRAIRSVLGQTFPDLELIVVDDGSRDGSFALIQALQARDPRLVHVRHERNCGIHILRTNEGIELARGRHVAFQFDDDSWRPHALDVLVATARRAPGCVAVGKAECTSRTRPGSFVLPQEALSFAALHERNRIANNALLVPIDLFDRHGMYDCHIGMRRLCDWDLWLRLMRHVEFLLADEIISDVSISNPGAIALTVPHDVPLFRFFREIPRDALLTPRRWRDYEVDSRRVGDVDLAPAIWRRLYQEQIAPYYCRFRHVFPAVEGFPSTAPGERTPVLCVGSGPTSGVALDPPGAVASPWARYQAHFQHETQLSVGWWRESDMVLMLRPDGDRAGGLIEQGEVSTLPMGVYMDDDSLAPPEPGPRGAEGAGPPARRPLDAMIGRVDAVWVTSRFVAEWVQPCTRRIVLHPGSISGDELPSQLAPRDPGRPVRIGCVGTGYHPEHLRVPWRAALERVAAECGPRVEFEFWGLDVSSLPALASPMRQVAGEAGTTSFLRRLREARFDWLLTPLLDHSRRLARGADRYVQAAVAGAVAILPRVPPYLELPEGLTCLQAENTEADWYRALREAVDMPEGRFEAMRRRTLAHVCEDYSGEAELDLNEAAWGATEWHGRTRGARGADGRPRVLYAVGHLSWEGPERLQRWVQLVQDYGVEAVVVLSRGAARTPDGQRVAEALREEGIVCEVADIGSVDEGLREVDAGVRGEVGALLEQLRPALVHTLGLVPVMGEECAARGLAHVASLYGVDAGVRWEGGTGHCALNHADSLRDAERWRDWLGGEKFCGREVVGRESFEVGLRRHLEDLGSGTDEEAGREQPARGQRRVLMAGPVRAAGGHLEAIGAVAELKQTGVDCDLEVWGETEGDPAYVARCAAAISAGRVQDRVKIRSGQARDLLAAVAAADIVVSAEAGPGGFPLPVKEAMATGAVLVATPGGSAEELVIDGVTGILCRDGSAAAMAEGLERALGLAGAERRRVLEQARRVARAEFHPRRAARDVFAMYNRALELTQGTGGARGMAADRAVAVERASGRGARGRGEQVDEPEQAPRGHVRLHRKLTYRVTPRWPGWCGVDLLVGTHQQPATGRLEMTVRLAGKVVRRTAVDLATARDNEWVRFEFAPIPDAAERPFELRFVLADAGPRTRLSLYDLTSRGAGLRHRALGRLGLSPTRNSLYCRIRYAR